jgi:hypothetical protein
MKLSRDNRCPSRDANRETPEDKCTALPLYWALRSVKEL